MDRREFIGCLGCAIGLSTATARPLAGKTLAHAGFDENLAVIVSDSHVKAANGDKVSRSGKAFADLVDEILAMKVKPHHFIHLGDLSVLTGEEADYEAARPQIERLQNAGIKVAITMGNHDRRGSYLKVFPDGAKGSLVDGRHVYLVAMPKCDVLLLDTLIDLGKPKTRNPVNGELSGGQLEFLEKFFVGRTKPVLIASHHPVLNVMMGKRKLKHYIAYQKSAVAFLHGHNHTWTSVWAHPDDWKNPVTIDAIGLPSSGCDGDIGYVLLKAHPDRATISLKQRDFFYPNPVSGKGRPPQWDQRVKENMAGGVRELFYDRKVN